MVKRCRVPLCCPLLVLLHPLLRLLLLLLLLPLLHQALLLRLCCECRCSEPVSPAVGPSLGPVLGIEEGRGRGPSDPVLEQNAPYASVHREAPRDSVSSDGLVASGAPSLSSRHEEGGSESVRRRVAGWPHGRTSLIVRLAGCIVVRLLRNHGVLMVEEPVYGSECWRP